MKPSQFDALKEDVKQDWRFHRKWREQARDDYAFYDGKQWSDRDEAQMREDNRIPITFNRVAPIINAIVGAEVNNRTEVRYIPRTMGDAKVNEALSAGGEWFRDSSSAEDEDSEAFRDAVICGIGCTDTGLDFEADDEGEPDVTRIDPTKVFWDRHATRKALSDAQRVGVVLEMPLSEAKDRFPGFTKAELDAQWIDAEGDGETPHTRFTGRQWEMGEGGEAGAQNSVRIVQVQWCEKAREMEYLDPMTGQKKTMARADYDKLIELDDGFAAVPARAVTRKVWRQAFLGNKVLQENQPCADYSTFKFITGTYDRKERMWYGALRSMRHPQMFANKWLSSVLHIISVNAKGGLIMEETAVSDVSKFEESWASADSISWVREGGLGKVQEKGQAEFPAALMNLTEFAISSIRDVSGVNLELLGMREANQPGVLEYQRKQSAMTTLAGLFDALRLYRKEQGKVILYFLRKHIAPTGRLVRLMEDGQATYQPLTIDDDAVKYDVIVDDAPSAPNQKEKTWAFIEQMMPLLQNAGLSPETWLDILEHSPLPVSLIGKLRKEAERAQQAGPDPMQQQMQALAIRKEESEIAENEANSALDQIKAQQIAQEAALALPRLQIDAMRAAPNPIPQAGGFA